MILLQLSPHRSNIRGTMPYAQIGLGDQARMVAATPASRIPQAKASDDAPPWECLRSELCGEPCHLPSSDGNTVTMELATVNDENPCGDRGLDAVAPVPAPLGRQITAMADTCGDRSVVSTTRLAARTSRCVAGLDGVVGHWSA